MKVLRRRIDLSGFVPYTGATGNLDMGVHNISATLLYGDGSNLTNLPLTPPAGNDTEIQFNNGGVFGASSNIRTPSLFLSPATIPSGAGVRLLWDSVKGAFRAGQVTSVQWDEGYIGNHSSAFGVNTRASGTGTVAFGSGSIASGLHAVAFGSDTIASGQESFAFGRTSLASGYRSFAGGFDSHATNNYAFAVGSNCRATGSFSTAIGSACHATGHNSFAVCNNCHATGLHSFAAGNTAHASGQASIALSGRASGFGAIAIGNGVVAQAHYSTAIGRHSQSLGYGSFAFNSGNFNTHRIDNVNIWTDNQKTIFLAKYTMDAYDMAVEAAVGSNFMCHRPSTALLKIRGVCKSENDKHASFEYRTFIAVPSSGNGVIINEEEVYMHDTWGIIDYIEFYFSGNQLICYIDNGINEKVGIVVEYDALENNFKAPEETS